MARLVLYSDDEEKSYQLEEKVTYIGRKSSCDIVIDDKTPAFTSFNSASCILPLSANLTGCSASIQPGIGATGPIQWTFNPGDTLQSGSSGQLQYQVTVDN